MARKGPERYTGSTQVPRTNEAKRRQIKRDYVRNIRSQTEQARRNMRKGMAVVVLAVLFFSGKIFLSLYQLAVKDHRYYSELAANTHTVQYPYYAARGNIVDAEGKELAISTYTYTIGITPSVFGPRRGSELSEAEAEEQFCRILDLDVYEFRKTLKEEKDAAYVPLGRTITAEQNDELTDFLNKNSIGGVSQDANQARYYPQKDLASSIIGFANKSEGALAGVTGIEAYYNNELSGKAGYVYRQVDNYWAQALPNTSSADVPAVPGYNLRLCLDSELQRLVQGYTYQMAEFSGALNGSELMVLNAQTGEVLAMSGESHYDLNNPLGTPTNYESSEPWDPEDNKEQMDYVTGTIWNNRSTHYPHETGSVMKPFVLGMALDEAVIGTETPLSDDFVYIEGWPYPISSYDGMSRGMLSPRECIWDSRNPPFVRLAQMLGTTTFYDYIKALGLRDPTGIDLPYEQTGLIHTDENELNMAVTAFGEQVTITGMQMANDYVMLANGGNLLKPRIADALLNNNGDVVKEYKTEVVRQVLSADTCRNIREMMVGVGRYGTGKSAYVPGIEAAYKTGTSSRVVGDYDYDNMNTHTAVCLLPADEPQYVIYAVIHDSENPYHKSAQVAVREIAEYILAKNNVPLHYKAYDYNFLFVPRYPSDMHGMSRNSAGEEIYAEGLVPVLAENFKADQTVATQYPPAGMNMAYNGRMWISGKEDDYPNEYVTLPDFTGLTAEEALRKARKLNLNVALSGAGRAGKVTSQEVVEAGLAGGKDVNDKVRIYSLINLHFDDDSMPGPYDDDSLTIGYNDGSGMTYGG